MKKTIIILFTIVVLILLFPQTPYGKALQYKEQVYRSMYTPISKKTDLKSAQITHLDGTPIKLTLSAFNFNPLGTTGGYVEIVKNELYLGYRNPDNATPTIDRIVLLHELVHLVDGNHAFKKICKNILNSECMEGRAYAYTHLYEQVLDLEKKGWLVIK